MASRDFLGLATYVSDDDGSSWVPAAGHHGPVVAPVPDPVNPVPVQTLEGRKSPLTKRSKI
jgi:hypothetical protein